MFKQVVYVEEEIQDHPNTQRVLSFFKEAVIVSIRHYKDVFNQSGADWRVQKSAQKLILAKRSDQYYYKGSDITPSFGYRHFYYNTLALNCVYDCSYCYLQGMFTSAHMVLFVNTNDFITATRQLIQQVNEPVYMALSYDTDLLAIEAWYPYCAEWIAFSKTEPLLTIEIRTKSGNIQSLLKQEPHPGVVLAWTLSPDEIITQHEPLTPSLMVRIKALKKVLDKGWRVRVCFDPVLAVPGWKAYYSGMIRTMATEIQFGQLDSFSVGVFRMNRQFLKNMQGNRSDSPLLFDTYVLENDVYSYADDLQKEMYSFIKAELETYCQDLKITFT